MDENIANGLIMGLMDDDVPPALSNRSREALRAPVTLSFFSRARLRTKLRCRRLPSLACSRPLEDVVVVVVVVFVDGGIANKSKRRLFFFSFSCLNQICVFCFLKDLIECTKVSEFFCQFLSCCQFSPPPDQTMHLLSIFFFVFVKELVVAC